MGGCGGSFGCIGPILVGAVVFPVGLVGAALFGASARDGYGYADECRHPSTARPARRGEQAVDACTGCSEVGCGLHPSCVSLGVCRDDAYGDNGSPQEAPSAANVGPDECLSVSAGDYDLWGIEVCVGAVVEAGLVGACRCHVPRVGLVDGAGAELPGLRYLPGARVSWSSDRAGTVYLRAELRGARRPTSCVRYFLDVRVDRAGCGDEAPERPAEEPAQSDGPPAEEDSSPEDGGELP